LDHATSYQSVLHSQTLAVGEARLLNHCILSVFSGHLDHGVMLPKEGWQRETTFWPSTSSPRTSSNTWRLNKWSRRPRRTSHWCGEGVATVKWSDVSCP